jgi:hypothetical protein
MKKNVFGKGESVIIDRIIEKFPVAENIHSRQKTNASTTIAFSNKEYFYVLRKMFHTFMFDIKEFAVDFLDTPLEEYINQLVWLTYVQTVIYKLDLSVEKLASNFSELDIHIEAVRNELILFFKEHNLYDTEMEESIDNVIKFLAVEREKIRQDTRLSLNDIFYTLELKSADLEVLRRIVLKVGNARISEGEMEFFKLLDKIREIFDDIRDFEEDRTLKNFNTVLNIQSICHTADAAFKILTDYIENECKRCLFLAETMKTRKRRKLLAICARLDEEKNYYFNLLRQIPFQQMTDH